MRECQRTTRTCQTSTSTLRCFTTEQRLDKMNYRYISTTQLNVRLAVNTALIGLLVLTIPIGCQGCRQDSPVQNQNPEPVSHSEVPPRKPAAELPNEKSPPTSNLIPSATSPEESANQELATQPRMRPSAANDGGTATSTKTNSSSHSGETSPAAVTNPIDAQRLGANWLKQAQSAAQEGQQSKAFMLLADSLALTRRFPDDAACQELAAKCESLLEIVTPQLKPTGTPGDTDGRTLIEQ